MKIGIVDADLIGRRAHRFPNLACEKISGYWKRQGADVVLLTDYDWHEDIHLNGLDHVYIAKVFTDTPVPEWLTVEKLNGHPQIHIGGTGFYFDEAPPLCDEIEHQMPDYTLYDQWIEQEAAKERQRKGPRFKEKQFLRQFSAYKDYSIGFMTRGCFRKCAFCVNQKYNRVFEHSRLEEFYDPARQKVCLLDDNFFGYPGWRDLLIQLKDLGKPFTFKQGLDERLLTEDRCKLLFSSVYDGDFTFAFDNIADYPVIEEKLRMIRRFTDTENIRFYILVGFESVGADDIAGAFRRIELLMRHRCKPYVMRYRSIDGAPWEDSEYRGMYIQLAAWANQPGIFKKKSFREFCLLKQKQIKTGIVSAPCRAMKWFEEKHPEIASRYFDMRYLEVSAREE